jgi:multidrug resistance efflux pump
VVVERRDVEDVFLLTGELQALRSVPIATPRFEGGGVQIKWLAEDGAEVREGDRVVEFDSTRVLASLEERRTRLRQVLIEFEEKKPSLEAEQARRQAAVEEAEIEVQKAALEAAVPRDLRSLAEWRKKQAALLEKRVALTKAQAEQEALVASSRADLEVLQVNHEKARRDLEAAERSYASAAVQAPKDGIFIVGRFWRDDRKLQAGDNVWVGLPVASIPDLSEMEVTALLPEVDHGAIAAGMAARVILDTYPDRSFAGRVEEVGAVAPESRSGGGFPVRVSLAQTDHDVMRPGVSARVEVVRRRFPQALSLARGALSFEGAQAFANRKKGSPVPVEILGCSPLVCALASGLEEKDRVLLR